MHRFGGRSRSAFGNLADAHPSRSPFPVEKSQSKQKTILNLSLEHHTQTMKRILYMGSMAALMLACSQKEDVQPTPSRPEEPTPSTPVTLSLEMASGSYAEDSGEEYPLAWSEGDAVALYTVLADGTLAQPVKLTLGSDGQWTPALEHTDGNRYFACYPWQEKFNGEVDASATDDQHFFAQAIAGWVPVADQSDPATGVKNSSLMTAAGAVTASESGATLRLSFTPRMALVSLSFPKTVYHFDNSPAIADYEVPISNPLFKDHIPQTAANGSYLYVVNPQLATTLSGLYNGQTSWSVETGEAAAGKINRNAIGKNTEVNHTLQVGDFFLADGTLLSKDADAATIAASPVIGVVYQLDPNRIGEADKKALGGVVHGQVISTWQLTPTSQDSPLQWSTYGGGERDESSIGLKPIPDLTANLATNVRLADNAIDGYYYTTQILTERATDVERGLYPLFSQVKQFANLVGGPLVNCTTGWYLPAIGQWFDVIRNLGKYELALDSDELVDYGGGCFYWSNKAHYDIPVALNQAMEKVSEMDKFLYDTQSATALVTSSILSDKTSHCLMLSSYFPISLEDGSTQYTETRINVLNGPKTSLYNSRLMLTF